MSHIPDVLAGGVVHRLDLRQQLTNHFCSCNKAGRKARQGADKADLESGRRTGKAADLGSVPA